MILFYLILFLVYLFLNRTKFSNNNSIYLLGNMQIDLKFGVIQYLYECLIIICIWYVNFFKLLDLKIYSSSIWYYQAPFSI